MGTVKASFTWDGAKRDILRVFVEPTPPWTSDPIDERLVVFVALDENDKETGDIAGIEILDFLKFDRWNDLPKLPLLWQFSSWEPLALEALLKRAQRELQARESMLAQHAG